MNYALTTEHIARVAHEANRALQQALGENPNPHWDECGPALRNSAMRGVDAAHAGATPEQLHTAWCAEHRTQGWVYGPAKNPDTKTHPCLVDYTDLPPAQRSKDILFAAIVDALT